MKELRYFAALAIVGACAVTFFAYQTEALDMSGERTDAYWLAVGAPDLPDGTPSDEQPVQRDNRGRTVVDAAPVAPAGFAIPESRSRAEAKTANRISTVTPDAEIAASMSRRDGRPVKHALAE